MEAKIQTERKKESSSLLCIFWGLFKILLEVANLSFALFQVVQIGSQCQCEHSLGRLMHPVNFGRLLLFFSYHHLFAFLGLLKTFCSLLFPCFFSSICDITQRKSCLSLSLSFFPFMLLCSEFDAWRWRWLAESSSHDRSTDYTVRYSTTYCTTYI